MQDAQTGASQAQNAKQALAAAQANLEHCRRSLRHLEQLQEMFLEAGKDAGDMEKQLAELRCDTN